MNSPNLTTVLLPPATGRSIGRNRTDQALGLCPRGPDAASKLGKIQSPQMGRIHRPLRDTSTPQGELLVTILAGFATFERHLIKARTDEGRKRAKGRGVRFGRPRKLDQHQRQEALQRLANGETLVDVARTYGVDPTTIGGSKALSCREAWPHKA